MSATTEATNPAANNSNGPRHLSPGLQIIITTCYLVGILGNSLALIIVFKKDTRPSNLRHRLMLTCLATNDLTALLGMLILMYMQLYFDLTGKKWFCSIRVIWRVFGLGSGCVTVIMAVERWLAITKPFFYQKHVTVVLLRRCIFGLWILAVILVCMPFGGFGLYFSKDYRCARYRNATETIDIAYAYLYFSLGMLLCVSIVCCNIGVMRSLCFKGFYSNIPQNCNGYTSPNGIQRIHQPVLMRRMSRSCSKMSTTSTREEMAFGRLMVFLCIICIICWMPQLLTIPLAQLDLTSKTACNIFYRIADVLMALHFLLDPYVYVIQRLPTIRRLLSATRPHHNKSKTTIRILSQDQSAYFTKV